MMWMRTEIRLIARGWSPSMTSWKRPYSGLKCNRSLKRGLQLSTTGTGSTLPKVFGADFTGARTWTCDGYDATTALGGNEVIKDL